MSRADVMWAHIIAAMNQRWKSGLDIGFPRRSTESQSLFCACFHDTFTTSGSSYTGAMEHLLGHTNVRPHS